jgi:putative heme-binding domain-containing protein
MDWCDKYPCYQNAKANPEGVDRQYGRIWRVVTTQSGSVVPASADSETAPPKGGTTEHASRPTNDLDLKKLSTTDLVKTLEHPNNWMRRMARRMLIEQHAEGTQESLLQIAKSDSPVPVRLEAIWTLAALNTQDYQAIEWLAKNDPNPALKAWAARLFGEGGHVGHDWLDKLAENPDPGVRLAVSIALRQKREVHLTSDRTRPSLDSTGRSNGPTILETKLLKAGVDPDDKVLPQAIWMAIEPVLADGARPWLDWLADIAPNTQPLSRTLSHKAMRRLCDTRKAENLDLAVEFCDQIAEHDILLAHVLDGLVKGQEGGVIKPVKEVSASLAKWRSSSNADVRKHAQTLAVMWGDAAAVKEMVAVLHDGSKSEKERITVLQSLQKVRTDGVKDGLRPLLTPQTSTALAVAAIRAAADLGGDEFIAPLLQQSASKDFNMRNAAIEALSNREAWTKALLNAISEQKVSASGFPAPVRRALATHKDKAIRDLAYKVLGAWQDSSDDVKSLIAQKKQACLTGEPDLANGKLLFTATCMVCHEFHGGGQKVGPDLIGSGRSNLDALLANVIDPNQIIGNGYENISVSTKDGRTLAGRIVEDTPGHLKLLGAGGAAQVVPRDQIASLTNTKQSLMPMGFGNLPDPAFRDLIWYILAPPEEGPLTAEKKKLLIQGVELPETASQPKKTNWRAIDWENVSLWNPDWKVNAPDFERTPVKLAEYHGKTNVLLMHPFTDKKTPASFERQLKLEKTQLKFSVAADDRGDWLVKVLVNGQEVRALTVDHEKPRWKEVEVDLTKWKGQDINLRLEAHANGWAWEFAYWQGITLE